MNGFRVRSQERSPSAGTVQPRSGRWQPLIDVSFERRHGCPAMRVVFDEIFEIAPDSAIVLPLSEITGRLAERMHRANSGGASIVFLSRAILLHLARPIPILRAARARAANANCCDGERHRPPRAANGSRSMRRRSPSSSSSGAGDSESRRPRRASGSDRRRRSASSRRADNPHPPAFRKSDRQVAAQFCRSGGISGGMLPGEMDGESLSCKQRHRLIERVSPTTEE